MTDIVVDAMEALDLTQKPPAEEENEEEDFVDPWNVVGTSATGIAYEKIISKK